MAQDEVLIREGLGAVDTGRARAVAVEEVAALTHEAGDLERAFGESLALSLPMGGAGTRTTRWNLEPL